MANRFSILLLVPSGFAGIAFELLWVRQLALCFGSTTLSFSTVLAVFFGGLAIGSAVAGRRAARLDDPIRVYGLLELGIGAWGLGLHLVLTRLPEVFAAIDPGSGMAAAGVRVAVATPLLLFPTLLMGATLPIVCAGVIRRDADIGLGTGLIYAANTFGAFLGAYLTTYHLLPALGVWHSTIAVAATNFATGAMALVWSRRSVLPAFGSTSAETGSQPSHALAETLTFAGGGAAAVLQVVWVRVFSIALRGTVYGVGSVLICILVAMALGSLFVSRLLRATERPVAWFVGLQFGTVLSVGAICAALPRIAWLLEEVPFGPESGPGRLHAQLALVVAVLLAPAFCSGASFPLLVRIVERSAPGVSHTFGRLYAANTVGSIIGFLAGGFWLLPQLGSSAALMIAIGLTAVIAAAAALRLDTRSGRPLRYGLAAATLGAGLLFPGLDVRSLATPPDPLATYEETRARRERGASELLFFSEGIASTVSVYERDGARALSLNGMGQGRLRQEEPRHALESLLVALTPLAHREAAERMLVVGLGAGVTVDALLRLGDAEIEVVELEPKVIDAVGVVFGDASPLESDRVSVHVGDARHFLLLRSSDADARYDVITSMPAHPWAAPQVFTREFFELAAANLTEDGVFCTWFGVARMDTASTQSLFRAFADVFPNYAIYAVPEAAAFYLVGARKPLDFDPSRLERLTRHPLVANRDDVNDPLFLPARFYAAGGSGIAPPTAGRANTDDSAFVELYAPRTGRLLGFPMPPMPQRVIPEGWIVASNPGLFRVDTFESGLGTPGGALPVIPRTPTIPGLAAAFERTRPQLSSQQNTYIAGRLAYAAGDVDRARVLLAKVAREDEDLGARAAKFAAVAHRSREARIEALAALPPETDVLVRLLELDPSRGLARVPRSPVPLAVDPVGWLLRAVAHPGLGLDASPAEIEAALAPALERTESLALLDLCTGFAEARGMERRRAACASRLATRRNDRVDWLLERARLASQRGSPGVALTLLEEAQGIAPEREDIGRLIESLQAPPGAPAP